MDMEARSLAPDKGRPLLNKVREYKADLTSLREQLKQAAAGEALSRQASSGSANRILADTIPSQAVWQPGSKVGSRPHVPRCLSSSVYRLACHVVFIACVVHAITDAGSSRQ
jgi:hypothetical protein